MGAATPVKVLVGGEDVNEASSASGTGGDVLAFTIERDMGQPDMAAIVVSNQQATWSAKIKVNDTIEVKVGDGGGTTIYKGEVIGLEANYKGGEKSRVTIRAMNKMHRLIRQRKSITFTDKTDQQILQQVVGDAGLSLEWKHEKSITYKHVYQHNQTNMEFVRMRAGRMGCHVWCVDSTIHVKEPDLQQGPMFTLKTGDADEGAIREFRPRMGSSSVLKKVTVKGWNPETKELIQGDYTAQASKLGSQTSVAASSSQGEEESFTVDHPIWSVEEAKALAKAKLVDQSLGFMSGEVEVVGDPRYDLGKVVKIVASEEDVSSNDPFNGNYYIMGITHRYSHTKTKDGGFVTILRVARDAAKE
jgi:phage protein D